MIKLEDLKIGDSFYGVNSEGFGIVAERTVVMELFMLDDYPKPIEAVMCEGGRGVTVRSEEPYLYRTKEETLNALQNIRILKAIELLESEEFVDKLFECATSSRRLNKYGERPIFELAVNIYKDRLKEEN